MVVQILLDDLLDFVVEARSVLLVIRIHGLHPRSVLIGILRQLFDRRVLLVGVVRIL